MQPTLQACVNESVRNILLYDMLVIQRSQLRLEFYALLSGPKWGTRSP